ncbi:hypothetical protein [Streptomyces buecherae]|uniref:hypothetical protein n=1 Tax=Streptomyces buecherae TaxID=2763006 RepID=UPI0037B0588D
MIHDRETTTAAWIEHSLPTADLEEWRRSYTALLPAGLHWDVARLPLAAWERARRARTRLGGLPVLETRGRPVIYDPTCGTVYVPVPVGSVVPGVRVLRAGTWLLVHHPSHPAAPGRWLSLPARPYQLIDATALAAAVATIPAPRTAIEDRS